MSKLITYFQARQLLDRAILNLRARLSASCVTAAAAVDATDALNVEPFTGLSRMALIEPYRYAVALAVVRGWIVGRSALVGLVLPQRGGLNGATKKVSTRNRYTRTGKPKPFPSDSPKVEHAAQAKGKRSHYVGKWISRSKRKLPKLAMWGVNGPGRPSVPALWREYRKKKAKAAYLARKRYQTDLRREGKGWKPYARKDTGKGWSDPQPFFAAADAQLRNAKNEARAYNEGQLATLEKLQRDKWKAAH